MDPGIDDIFRTFTFWFLGAALFFVDWLIRIVVMVAGYLIIMEIRREMMMYRYLKNSGINPVISGSHSSRFGEN